MISSRTLSSATKSSNNVYPSSVKYDIQDKEKELNSNKIEDHENTKQTLLEAGLTEKDDFLDDEGHFIARLGLYDNDDNRHAPAYYGLAGEIVKIFDPETEADPIAVLVSFLTSFGNVIGDNAFFKAGGINHNMRLFSVMVGPTGSGKGMSMAPIKFLFKNIDNKWISENVLNGGLSSGEGLIYAVRDPVYKKEPVVEGKGKDKKITGYMNVLVDEGVKDKRILIIEEEYGKVLKVEKREGNTLAPTLRQLWETGSPRTLTKTPIQATGAHVSLIGHITLEELKKEKIDIDTFNGSANRILWVLTQHSKFLPSGGNFEKLEIDCLLNKLNQAVKFGKTAGELKRDEEAEKLWDQIYIHLRKGKGVIGAVTGRAAPYVMRLASIYALLDCSTTVNIHHLHAALSLWGYCFRGARFIFGNNNLFNDSNTNKLLEELNKHQNGMTMTEVSNLFNRHLTKAAIQRLADTLINSGYARLEVDKRKNGRPIHRLSSIK